jgi:hypothetical protein
MAKKSLKPAVQVLIDDRAVGTPRARWSSFYAGPHGYGHTVFEPVPVFGGGDVFVVAWVNMWGQVVRQKLAEGGTPNAAWWAIAGSNVRAGSPIAMALSPQLPDTFVFWVDADGRTIKMADAYTDYPSGVGTTVETLAAGHVCLGLAAVRVSSFAGNWTRVVLAWVDGATANGVGVDKTVKVKVLGGDGVTWGATVDTGIAAGKSCYGLAALEYGGTSTHAGLYLVVTGKFGTLTQGDNVNVYAVAIDVAANTVASTWRGCPLQASAGSVVNWQYPSVMPEVELDRARVFVQQYDGNMVAARRWQTGSVSLQTLADDSVRFGDWMPFNARCAVTMGVGRVWDYIWAICGDQMWRASAYDGGAPWRVDVSADLVAMQHAYYDNTLYLEDVTKAGWGFLILDNHDNRFAGLGVSGKYQAIKRGAQVVIKVGYQVEDPVTHVITAETLMLPPMWISRIIQVNNPEVSRAGGLPRLSVQGAPSLGGSFVVLALYDGWAITTHRLAKYYFGWEGAAPRTVLQDAFLTGMGFVYSDDGSATLARDAGTAAESWQTIEGKAYWPMIKAILNHTGTRLKFYTVDDEEATGPTVRVHVFTTTAADVIQARYGAAGEPLLYASVYWEQDRASWLRWMWWYNPPPETLASALDGASITGVRLEGKGIAEEYIPYDQVEELGLYQPLTVVDYNITGAETVTPEQRASFAAAQAVQGMQSGCILVPAHPGLELWDRIEITDARACFSPMSRRVAGIETVYDKRGGRSQFEQTVFLWGLEPW